MEIEQHVLHSPWTLYFQQDVPDVDYASTIHKIGTFNTVEQFWGYFAHLKRVNCISDKMEYHIFRNEIRGMWEDDENKDGGKWTISVEKAHSANYWQRAVLSLIGENLHEDIVGVIIALKAETDIISFWSKTGKAISKSEIKERAVSIADALELPVGAKLLFRCHMNYGKNSIIPFTVMEKKEEELSI